MKNRIIALAFLFLSLIGSLYGAGKNEENFLQKLERKNKLKQFDAKNLADAIKANKDLLNQVGENKEVPLITAILENRFDLAQKLVLLEADTKVLNKQGRTILDLMVDKIIQSMLHISPVENNFHEKQTKLENLEEECKLIISELLKQGVTVTEFGVEKIAKSQKKLSAKAKKLIAKIIQTITGKDLINKKIEYVVAQKGKFNRTLLHWTVQENMAQAAAALIANGADLNLIDSSKKTALGYAMINLDSKVFSERANALEKSEFMKEFISKLPDHHQLINSEILLETQIANIIKKTFLHWAAEELQEDICKLLIEKGADVGLKIDDETALCNLLENSQNYNYDEGKKDNDKNFKFWNIVFLLWEGHEASYKPEDIPLLEAFNAIGVLPRGMIEFQLKVRINFEKMIKAFINKINIQDKKNTNILANAISAKSDLKNEAQFNRWTSALEELIEKDGLNLNKDTPLHKLILGFKVLSKETWFEKSNSSALVEVIKKLLKKNPDLSIKNRSKQNPLHYAASLFEKITSDEIIKFKENYLKIISLLVEHGSPIEPALHYLLDLQGVNSTSDDVKKQLYDVMKAIIQSVPLNNNQVIELKNPEISPYVINFALKYDDIDFLNHLKKYNLNFESKEITQTPLLIDFKKNLNTKVVSLGDPADDNVLNKSDDSKEPDIIKKIKSKKFKDAIDFIIKSNIDPNIVDTQNRTPLDWMVNYIMQITDKNLKDKENCNELVKILLQKNVTLTEFGVKKIVQFARELSKERKEIIESIIIAGVVNKGFINKKIKYYLDETSEQGERTLLHWTAQQNMAEAAAALITNGADLNHVDSFNKTALGYAMIDLNPTDVVQKANALEKIEFMKKFISKLPDHHQLINSEILLEIKNQREIKKIFLHWAAKELQEDICKLLIQKGADVRLKIHDKMALCDLLYNHTEPKNNLKFWNIVFLLWKGHEASYKPEDIPLLEALKAACYLPTVSLNDREEVELVANFQKMIEQFIEKIDLSNKTSILADVINVDFVNKDQFFQWVIALKKLIEKNNLNLNNKSPLHKLILAFKKASKIFSDTNSCDVIDIIKRLLKKNPDLSIKNYNDQNPLHYAVSRLEKPLKLKISQRNGYLKIIEMLVKHGSPITEALNSLLEKEEKINDQGLKQELLGVIKTIIQAVSANNNNQVSELKNPEMSNRVINLAGKYNDIDFLKILEKYGLDFESKKITQTAFSVDFNKILNAKQEKLAKEKADKEAKEAQEKAEQEAKLKAEQAAQAAKEQAAKEKAAQEKAEQDAKLKAEKEAQAAKEKAEKEKLAKEKAAQEKAEKEAQAAKLKAAQEAQEAKDKAAQEAKLKAEREAKEKAAQEKAEQEAKLKAEKEAKENKKPSELESALKALKDKLNGLKEKLEKLREQLGKLKNALGAPVI